jgi:DNA-binding LacI/PurR family transcriptional regulator
MLNFVPAKLAGVSISTASRILNSTDGTIPISETTRQKVMFAADDSGGAKMAVEQLLKAGHRDIGFVRKAEFKVLFDRRQKGWADAIQAAEITPCP